jgi:ribosomal protein L11 methyltransferase
VTAAWWRLTITSDAAQVDAIAAMVVALTGNGVEEPRAGILCTTLESAADATRLRDTLCTHFSGIDVQIEETVAVDWSTRWRDGIVSRTFGRVILTPSWLPVTAAPGQVVVTIDPESAFGSGEHGSTRGALALLERYLRAGDRMLDFGSGSGVLAIAAAKLGARSAIGIEVDEQSVPIAESNAARNDVTAMTSFLVGDAAQIAPLVGPAELICSNILRSVNILLLPTILHAATPAATLIFAGMEEPEAELFRPVLEAHGLVVLDEVRDGGWWAVAAHAR